MDTVNSSGPMEEFIKASGKKVIGSKVFLYSLPEILDKSKINNSNDIFFICYL